MNRLYNIFILAILVFAASCVKDNFPPDCKKPTKPTVQSDINVNDGSPFQLTASGSGNSQYIWNGPNGFYSETQNPQFPSASLANNGTYWVKALVGYCYSDSVSTTVHVKSDTTCSLGDNYGDFPNGTKGPFPITTSCTSGGMGYAVRAKNADSSLSITIRINQKPITAGEYTVTSNPNPGNGQIFYQLTDQNGVNYFNTINAPGYVKLDNGKINVVICQVKFEGLGVFSANVLCH